VNPTFLYDTIFILRPGAKIPDNAVTQALDEANFESDIKISRRPSLDEVYKEVQGSLHTSGLMPSRPREEKVARYGVAWFTDERGRKHVRMIADMKKVKFHESNMIWPQNVLVPNLVYPALNVTSEGNRITCVCGRTGRLGDMEWNGKQCKECQEAERYEKETGFQKYVPAARFPRQKK
jgi:hypothetical protein